MLMAHCKHPVAVVLVRLDDTVQFSLPVSVLAQADEVVLRNLYKAREVVAVRYDSNLIVGNYLPGISVRMQVVLRVAAVEHFDQTSLVPASIDYLVGKVANHYYLPVM